LFIPSTTSPTVAHFCRSNDLSSSNFIVCGSLEYRNAGILECWVKSITPLLHHSNTLSHLLDRVPAPRNHQANFSLLSFRELGQAFFQPLFKASYRCCRLYGLQFLFEFVEQCRELSANLPDKLIGHAMDGTRPQFSDGALVLWRTVTLVLGEAVARIF